MFKMLRRHTKTVVWLIIMAFILWGGSSILVSQHKGTSYAGELFGKKVTYKEYNDMYQMVNLFHDQGVTISESFEDRVWLHLALRREAVNRGVQVSDEEVKQEIQTLFRSGEAFDPVRYEGWVRDVLKQSPRNFEEQIREFARIRKLVRSVLTQPREASEEEIQKQDVREKSLIEAEVLPFPTEAEARQLLEAPDREAEWQAAKEKNAERFTRTGLIPVEAVIQAWKVNEQDALALLDVEKSGFSPPIAVGSEFALFRILDGKKAGPAPEIDEKTRLEYRKKIIERKMQAGFQDWVGEVLRRARVVTYQ